MNVPFLSPFGGAFIIVPLMEGVHISCPPLEGARDSDCSGSNPYNNHLRHFVTPPPAEDSAVVLI